MAKSRPYKCLQAESLEWEDGGFGALDRFGENGKGKEESRINAVHNRPGVYYLN